MISDDICQQAYYINYVCKTFKPWNYNTYCNDFISFNLAIHKEKIYFLKWHYKKTLSRKKHTFIAFGITTPNNQGKPLKKYTFEC